MTLRARFCTWVLGFSAAISAGAIAEQLPVEYYASLPLIDDVALSPGGKRVALIVNSKGRTVVMAQKLGDDRYVPLISTENEDFLFNWIRWANEDYVLLSARFPTSRYGVKVTETRLIALRADGKGKARTLVDFPKHRRSVNHYPQFQDHIVDMLPDDSEHIFLALDLDEPGAPGVYRVNVATGKRKPVHGERDGFTNWMTDQQHRVRVGIRFQGNDFEIHYLDLETRKWNRAWRYQALSGEFVEPLGFGLDPNTLFVRAYHEGHLAVFSVDLFSPDLTRQLVFATEGRDAQGVLLHSPKSGEAVGLLSGNGQYEIWDEDFAAFAQALAGALPEFNATIVDLSQDESAYLLYASSDVLPGRFYYGNRVQGTLTPFGDRYPNLHPEVLSGKRAIVYTARDDTAIEGFLTLPVEQPHENLPAVVFPHGGPISQDRQTFDYWSEFFANRGYAVLQMNFRGSSGYGIEFMQAGLQRWGLQMQDDIEDGTRWLIDEGIADPDRICIVGGSYGGYAALMAVARSPDMFRCAISFAGVTDLRELIRSSRRFTNKEIVADMVGKKSSDLKARSPVTHAENIRVPVLLVQGTADRVVGVKHGRLMRDALSKSGKAHTYIEQDGGNHYLSDEQHRLTFFQAMDSFLAQHLAP